MVVLRAEAGQVARCYWAGVSGGTEAGDGQVASGGRTPVHLRPLPLFQRGAHWGGGKGKYQNKLGQCLHCYGPNEDTNCFWEGSLAHITSYHDLIYIINSVHLS